MPEEVSVVEPEIIEEKSLQIEDDALADASAGRNAKYVPPSKDVFKPFVPVAVSNFQIIRLGLTPRCFYTYYQMALDRLLKKAIGKMERELEISTLMKRVRDSDKLCKSMELTEVFKGLKKKYKNSYTNVLNVSLETQNSIEEERAPPILPAEIPYQRKKLKKYFQRDDGFITSKIVVDPYELDPGTVKSIAQQVWKKLKADGEAVKKIERQLAREYRVDKERHHRGRDLAPREGGGHPKSDEPAKGQGKGGGQGSSLGGPPDITGFSELPSQESKVDNSLIRETAHKVVRKEMHKLHGNIYEGDRKREDQDPGVLQLPLGEGGGGSNSQSSFLKRKNSKNPATTEHTTSYYTSYQNPSSEQGPSPRKSSRRRDRREQPDQSIDKSKIIDKSRMERPSQKSKLDKTNKMSASFRSGSIAFKA